MSRNSKLLILTLFVIISAALFTVFMSKNRKQDSYLPGVSEEVDRAVNAALELYQIKKTQGLDFSKAPCLTNDLMPNWVVDIVHKPRIKTDDLSANQCQAYSEGRAQHFVELDINGNIVRVK